MKKRTPTTVNLLGQAQVIKEDLAPVYGLQRILSAGLILFGKLSAVEQMQLLKEMDQIDKAARQDHSAAVRNAARQLRKRSGSRADAKPA